MLLWKINKIVNQVFYSPGRTSVIPFHNHCCQYKWNQCSIHENKKLSNSPHPHKATHLHTYHKKKLQMSCVLPHCVGCEWLHTAEVSGVLVSVGQEGSWGESFSAKLSTGPESWSLANPVTLLSSGRVWTYHFFFQMNSILNFTLLFFWGLIFVTLNYRK